MIRAVVWVVGVVFGVVAVVSADRYVALASGRVIVDFFASEQTGELQRQYRAAMGRGAIVSTVGCLASFMFAFYRRQTPAASRALSR